MYFKKILAVVLTFVMFFSYTACAGGKNEQATGNTSNANNAGKAAPKLKVTVVDYEDNLISGVVLKIHKNIDYTAVSDNNGIATFNMYVTDGCRLTVVSCPDGYEYEGDKYVNIKSGTTELTIEINKK